MTIDQAMRAGETAVGGSFDVVVVGAGAAGGLAASMLCEGGLRVLLLDAGFHAPFWRKPFRRTTDAIIKRAADPRLLNYVPHKAVNVGRKALRLLGQVRQPVQTECFSWERMPEAFVDDRDHPYTTPPDKPFAWIRAHGLGGRMVVPGHGRQYYRLGEEDLFPTDGLSPPWPLQPGELDRWYDLVEDRLQLSGRCEGVASPPDSLIAHELQLTTSESRFAAALRERWPEVTPILGRHAPPLQSVDAAARTGRLACRTGAMVKEVVADSSGKAAGVKWRDARTGRTESASAPLVFLCASSLESTRILMTSVSASGLAPGAASGALGRNLMDHMMLKIEGVGARLDDDAVPTAGGRCLYLPRFDRRDERMSGLRGFGVQVYLTPAGASSWFTAVAFSESVPRAENRVTLDEKCKDVWGDPALRIDCGYSSKELEVGAHMAAALKDLAAVAGVRTDRFDGKPAAPGTAVHECGTARMGADAGTSVLDPHNQCWDVPGLYVTDGASFPSQGAQNPTLTIMALTARASDHVLRS